jgi:hypothetical protein
MLKGILHLRAARKKRPIAETQRTQRRKEKGTVKREQESKTICKRDAKPRLIAHNPRDGAEVAMTASAVGGGYGYAQFFQLCAGLAFFLGAGEALDYVAEFANAGSFLAELN